MPKSDFGSFGRHNYEKASYKNEFKDQAQDLAGAVDSRRDILVGDLREAELKLEEAKLRVQRINLDETQRKETPLEDIIKNAQVDVFPNADSLEDASGAVVEAEKNVMLAKEKLGGFDTSKEFSDETMKWREAERKKRGH